MAVLDQVTPTQLMEVITIDASPDHKAASKAGGGGGGGGGMNKYTFLCALLASTNSILLGYG